MDKGVNLRRAASTGSALLLISLTLLMIASPTHAQNHLWSFARGGTAGSTYGEAVTLDASGNVYVTGRFAGSTDLGDGIPRPAVSGTDGFVAKYDVNGEHVWSQTFGSAYTDMGLAVAVDDSGNVFVTGVAGSGINFGGGSLTGWPNSEEIFLLKLDAGGNHVWSKLFSNSKNNRGNGVDVDSAGNVFFTGSFANSINFGGGFLAARGLFGESDVFLAAYDSNGNHLWSQNFGGDNSDLGMGIAIDGMDDIVITGGYFSTAADFGGTVLTPVGAKDIFIAKYDALGNHLWSQSHGSTSNDEGARVATAAQGDVFLVGSFNGDLSLGGATLTAQAQDFFLAHYRSDGTHVWSRGYGGASNESSVDLAIDSLGNSFVSGSFLGTTDLGGGPLSSAGASDCFLARYNANGDHVWSKTFGNTWADFGYGVAATPLGEVVFTGGSRLSIDFGGGPIGVATTTAFVVKYGDETSSARVRTIVDIPNDQGRSVLVSFDASTRDVPFSPTPIIRYDLYRRIDFAFATVEAKVEQVELLQRAAPPGAWAFAGTVPAYGELIYHAIAPTLADSTIVDGLQESVFFVRAATADTYVFFDSQPDSGYSVDNLAPNIPAGLNLASNQLSWDEPTDADYRYNSVYGSNSNDFNTAIPITVTTSTFVSIQALIYNVYFVTATDFSGNESAAARLIVNVTGVDLPMPKQVAVSVDPNPFNPRTTLHLRVPRAGPIRVVVHDQAGRVVRTLLKEPWGQAGEYPVTWDGRDDQGRTVASGVYFYRLETSAGVAQGKMTLVK